MCKMGKCFGQQLAVNNVSIELSSSAEQFLARAASGAASCLKGSEDIRSLELCLERGDVKPVVNGNELPLSLRKFLAAQ